MTGGTYRRLTKSNTYIPVLGKMGGYARLRIPVDIIYTFRVRPIFTLRIKITAQRRRAIEEPKRQGRANWGRTFSAHFYRVKF